MDGVLQLLESIPEKVVDHGKACERLRQLVNSCQKHHELYFLPTTNIPECVQVLCSLKNKNKSAIKVLIPTEDFNQIKEAVSTLKTLISEGKCSLTLLLFAFLKTNVFLPLDLLVLLQNSDIMQVTTYLFKYSEKYGDTKWFCDSLFLLVKEDASRNSPIIVSLLASLLIVCETGSLTCAQDLASLSSTLTESFCVKIVEWVLSLPEDEVSSNEIKYLSELVATGELSQSSIRALAFAHLIKLTSTCNANQIIPMCEVPRYQSKNWKLSLAVLPLKSLLKEVVAVLGAEEVLRCIVSSLGKNQVNWRILLLLTSSALHADDGVKKTMAFIDQLLRRGLECDSQSDLGASLLFARQCCQEANSEFGTYSQWFGAHFGAGTASARSANQYQSLLNVLVTLVPAEPPAILRIHLNAVPKAPTSCHSLLRDYTELARARLDELNEPTEMGGLFLESYDGEEDTRAHDVKRVLEHFLRTEKVLKVVLEAAVFRRKYFEGVFLVELLQLPGWSQEESGSEEAAVRHAFIEKLKSLDKIPPKLYLAYKKSGDDKMEEGAIFKSLTENRQQAMPKTDLEKKIKRKLQIQKKP